ncbi:MAG: flippase [Prosthecobacter sp.]|jgi:PST family polysaccharide transporter|uniref:flippase n=1 Tax=Prosthecobacter sp. TaxID=1965333 RepID=UPI0019EE03A4|nr:flippase [Prosthecobacter sp.]MBE2283714.1 flippase [Prosthecobacter sp.]
MNDPSQSAPHPRAGLHRMISGFSQSVILRVLRLSLNVVVTGLLARHLGSAGFGALAASLALVSLLYTLAELGMNRVLVRELLHSEADEAALMGSSFYTRMVAGLVLFAGLVIYAGVFKPAEASLLLIYGLALLTHAITDVIAWFEAERHMPEAAWCQFGGFALSVAAIVAGVLWRAPLWFFALTFIIECLAVATALLVRYHQLGGSWKTWRWSKTVSFRLLRESWYELATQLTLLMLLRLDAVMVQALRGETEAGFYSAAVRVSEVAYFLPVLLCGFMMPPLMDRKQKGSPDYANRIADYFGVTLAVTVPIAGLMVLASAPIISLLFGAGFRPAASMLVVHAWALIPYALGIARTQYLTIEGRLSANVPAVIFALIINMGLNWLWIPVHGGLGAAWATLIAYSIAWVVSTPIMPATRGLTSLTWQGILRLPRLLEDTLGRLRRPVSPLSEP